MNFSRSSYLSLKNNFVGSKHFKSHTKSFSCAKRQAMRFVQYKYNNELGLGIQLNNGEQIVSLSDADQTMPVDMVSFLHNQYSIEKVEKQVYL